MRAGGPSRVPAGSGLAFALAGVVAGAACSDSADPAPRGPVVEDSAGVRIVTNPGIHVADTTSLVADDSAAVSIGQLEGEEPYLFGSVVGAVRRSDGRVFVADGVADEVRIFDGEGRYLDRFGGPGEGPGEFTWTTGFGRYRRDSLVVLDHESSRPHILGPEGEWARTVTRVVRADDPDGRPWRPRAFFEDGSVLAFRGTGSCRRTTEPGELCVDSARFVRLTLDGELVADYGVRASGRRITLTANGRSVTVLLAGQPRWVTRGDDFVYADGQEFEYRVYDRRGALREIVRVDDPRRPHAWADVLRQAWRSDPSGNEELLRAVEPALEGADFPGTIAWVRGLMVDAGGRVWIESTLGIGKASASRAGTWFVFSPEGALTDAVAVQGMSLDEGEIGEDYLLGITRDELGVEGVRVVPLRRALTPGPVRPPG